MRVSLLRRFRPAAFLVMLFMSCREAHSQDFLNLVIPEFKVENATLEQAITELHKWGIPVCLEKVPSDEQVTFSIHRKNASVMDILNTLVAVDMRYSWERFRSMTPSLPILEIINVFPKGAKQDPENLMNVKVSHLELKDVNPSEAIRRIYHLIPELRERYWKLVPPGGIPREISPLSPPRNRFFISLELHDVTVRDVLNEIALRSGGVCWIYEASKSPPRYTWRTFR